MKNQIVKGLMFMIQMTMDGFDYTIEFLVWCIDQYVKVIDYVYDQYSSMKYKR